MKRIGILIILALILVVAIVFLGQHLNSKSVIDIAEIKGIDAPQQGVAPVLQIEETEQFSGTVSWTPNVADNVFDYSTEYTAKISINPKKGFSLEEVPENFFTVEGGTVRYRAGTNTITVKFPKTVPETKTPINIPVLPGLELPIAGQKAPSLLEESEQYTGTISWKPSPTEDVFEYSTKYSAIIEITPKQGYILDEIPENFFKVPGAILTNKAGSGLIQAEFPKTASEPIKITISEVQGVFPPIASEKPASKIIETQQFRGSVSWSPSTPGNKFGYNTQYTAKVKITAKPGFTLSEIPKDFFTIEGAKTSNTENSGVVTAIFPSTLKEITISSLKGIPVPGAKEKPQKVAINTEQYSGTLKWIPSITDAGFDYDTSYTAELRLEEKEGYTFAGLNKSFFKINGAQSTKHGGNGLITAIFPKTKKGISIFDIPNVEIPVAGTAIKEVKINTDEYSGELSWSPLPANKVFKYFTEYTATIKLNPKSNYTLAGLEDGKFKIKGATLTYNKESGVVTAVFRKTLKQSYDIGDIGPSGGYIFYIDKENKFDWKYLEVTPYDPVRKNRWGEDKAVKGNTLKTEMGYGEVATRALLESDQQNTIASFSKEFELGGYNDWFCPTTDELITIYKNLVESGIANVFSNKSFWTSNEDGFDTAYTISFFNGSCSSGIYKKARKNILLIRSF